MSDLLTIAILPMLLTLGAYQLGLLCQRKLKSALANPVLIAVILVLLFMLLTGLENATYQAGMSKMSWMLTPATVLFTLRALQRSMARCKSAMLTGLSK